MGLFRRKQPQAEVTVRSEVIDGADFAGLSEDIMKTLEEHGIEPGQNTVIDAGQVPGLTEEIMGALNESGVWQQAFTGLEALAESHHEDPVAQLDKLAELHKKGHLSDFEFAQAKEKILGQDWDQPSA